jgi:hypothetical protein
MMTIVYLIVRKGNIAGMDEFVVMVLADVAIVAFGCVSLQEIIKLIVN